MFLKFRALLVWKQRKIIVASVFMPILMVSVAVGMSAAIQSGIPSAKDQPMISIPHFPYPPLYLAPNTTLAWIGKDSPLAKAYLTQTLNQLQTTIQWKDFIDEFELQKYNQKVLQDQFLTRKTGSVIPGGIGLSNTTNYFIVTDKNVEPEIQPLLIYLAEMMKQIFDQTNTLFFLPSLKVFASKAMLFDVASRYSVDNLYSIVPPFLANGLVFMPAFFGTQLVADKQKGHFHYLLILGIHPSTYYISSFLVDWGLYMFAIIASSIILWATSFQGFISTNYLIWFLPMFFAGPTLILMGYILSFLFKKEESAEISMFTIYIVSIFIPTFNIYQSFALISKAVNEGNPMTIESLSHLNDNPILPLVIIFILQFFLFAFILSALVHQNLTHVSFIQSIRSFFQPTIPSIPQKEQVIVNMHKQSITNDEEISKEHELLQQSLTNENPFAIRIMGLSYSYQTTKKNVNQIQPSCTVLNNLWLGLKHNECYAFLGPNGAGKSTTLSILTGIFNPNSFDADTHVFLENESIYPKYSNNARKFIGSCPQFDVLFENLTVYEHLVWIYRLKGETNQLSIENHINTLLNDLGKQMFILELVDMKWRKVSALSGGNKRKVSLACACLGNPKIIFLDEPTTGVDVSIRRSIWSFIKNLKKTCSIFLISHSMEECEYLADRIGIIINGNLKCLGTPSVLKSNYGCGFKITILTSGSSEKVIDWWLSQTKGWEITRTVGKTIQLQLSHTGIYELKTKLNNCSSNQERSQLHWQEMSELFAILEKGKQDAELQITSFQIRETSMGEVFTSFAKLQGISDNQNK